MSTEVQHHLKVIYAQLLGDAEMWGEQLDRALRKVLSVFLMQSDRFIDCNSFSSGSISAWMVRRSRLK